MCGTGCEPLVVLCLFVRLLGRIIYFLKLEQIICLYGFICCVHIKTIHALKQRPFN